MINKVLLIEDSQAISKSITVNLQENGYTIFGTDNFVSGLEVLSRVNVDLIIADINMKHGKYNDFIRVITEDNILKTIPILLLSNEESWIRDRINHRKEEWLIKPFSNDRLLATIRNFPGTIQL